MNSTPKIIQVLIHPLRQAIAVALLIILFTLLDLLLPHKESIFETDSGTWIVATSMILCYIIVNTVMALRITNVIPYWSKSVLYFLALLLFSYLWCILLTGKHIDEVGSFRWLWFVLTLVYLVFFAIIRSMKRIVDLVIRQDEKLRDQ